MRGRLLLAAIVAAGSVGCTGRSEPPPPVEPVAERRGSSLVASCPGATVAEPGVGLASTARVRNDLDEPVLVTMDRCVGHVRVIELEAGSERVVSLPRPSVRHEDGFRFHVYTRAEEWVGLIVTPMRGTQPEVVIQAAALETDAPPALDAALDYDRFEALLDEGRAPRPPIEGVDVVRWEIGGGDRTVIVLHGGPYVSHTYLRPEWEAIAQHSRVIFYDQRGCGESSREGDMTWPAHVADLRRLVEATSPEGVVLAGTGWGATLALLFAIEHPERVDGLVLTAVQGWRADGTNDIPDHIRARLDSVSTGLDVDRWPQPVRLGGEGTRATVDAEMALRDRMERCDDVRTRVRRRPHPRPSIRELAEVDTPILILQGRSYGSGLELARILPHAEVRVFEDALRDPWASVPHLFFEEVRRFVEGLPR